MRLHQRAWATVFCGFALLPGGGAAAAERPGLARPSGADPVNSVYLVQLSEEPALAYTGRLAGLAATRPAAGRKIDPDARHVARYVAHLKARHDTVLRSAGGGRKLYSYGYTVNAFAAELTPAQARRLQRAAGVLRVQKDVALRQATSFTPNYLGLAGPTGVWAETGATGEDIIIGLLDSGIWPEHASVSDSEGGYGPLPAWRGRCVSGEAFTPSMCNQKLIGARYFNEARGGNAGIDAQFPDDYNSPRDYNSHGTMVATIAGGNARVPVTGTLSTIETVGSAISGMAPRARLAVYKTSWGGIAFTSDTVAAIDRAVADGVDVLNYSFQGERDSFNDLVSEAFRQASAAGIFVSAAAGNDGPDDAPVGNIAPWFTTVGASTHPREARGLLTLGDGTVLRGRSAPAKLPAAPLLDSMQAGRPGADPELLAWCFGAADGAVVLDPARVAGKVVICERGGSDRVNKSRAVKQAGGVGMVLVNSIVGDLAYADLHALPTVHLFAEDRTVLKTYAARPGATASIDGALIYNAAAPYLASFSSRGPVSAGGGALLKPDLVAPGYDVLSGVAPFEDDGVLFYVWSGTSVSTPHVAGLAALFRQIYPGWSPMAIKSALMTTATDLLDATTPAERLMRQGAGHVRPRRALNPGLVFDAGPLDWFAFLCGVGESTSPACAAVRADPSDLNGPSIAIGELVGQQSVKRRLTNVSGNAASFSASHSGLAGIDVVVSPPVLTLAAGQTKEIYCEATGRCTGVIVYFQTPKLTKRARMVLLPLGGTPITFTAW